MMSKMGIIHIMERGGDELREYKKALRMAKKSIESLCELTDDMEDKYSERGSMREGYRRDSEDEMYERRYRR